MARGWRKIQKMIFFTIINHTVVSASLPCALVLHDPRQGHGRSPTDTHNICGSYYLVHCGKLWLDADLGCSTATGAAGLLPLRLTMSMTTEPCRPVHHVVPTVVPRFELPSSMRHRVVPAGQLHGPGWRQQSSSAQELQAPRTGATATHSRIILKLGPGP